MFRSYTGLLLVACAAVLSSCERPESGSRHNEREVRPAGSPWRAASSLPANSIEEVSLTPRSGTGEGSLFRRLAPAESGVEFLNPIDVTHSLKRLYYSGFGCGGVAVGDLDGDDRPDLFFASGPRGNRVYMQAESSLVFEDRTSKAGIQNRSSWGTGVALADVDNDGDLDVYVCNYDSPNELYINNGAGVFEECAEKFGLALVDACLLPTFCDYDQDGDLDVFVLTNRYFREGGRPREPPFETSGDGSVRVKEEFSRYYGLVETEPGVYNMDELGRPDLLLRNDGGVFTDVSVESGIQAAGQGLSATWWDYDQDGLMDIYVCNDFAEPDNLFRNNGDGTFTDTAALALNYTPWFSMGADAGDINNDGQLDFVALDMAATTHYKSKMAMGEMGTLQHVIERFRPRQVMRNCLYLNTGTGRLMECAGLVGVSNSDWSWAAKLADFDNDGKVDLYITNGMSRDFNNSDISFTPADQIGKSEWDHYENSPTKPEQNLSFRNLGNLSFEESSEGWGLDHVGMSYASACGDLDGDGDLDLVTVNLNEPVSIYRNDSQEGNRVTLGLRGRNSNRYGLGALVTVEAGGAKHVRQMVPVTGYLSSNEPSIHIGLGAAEEIDNLQIRWPDGKLQEFRGLSVNTGYRITESEAGLTQEEKELPVPLYAEEKKLRGIIHRETIFEDFTRQPLLPNKLSQLGPGIAVSDVDGDGSEDFYLATPRGQSGVVFLNDGTGRYRVGSTASFKDDEDFEGLGVLFFDADGDGDQDLYVASGGYEYDPGSALVRDRLYLNRGDGSFIRAPSNALPDFRDNSSCAVAADFDRDGDLDLFVGGRVVTGEYPMPARSRLLLNESVNGTVRFVSAPDSLAPGLSETGLVTGALWSDVDGDGWTDLLVTHEWGPVKLFKNRGGRLAEETNERGLGAHLGWWNSIAGGDPDRDGDIDYAVGNVGLNTKYHAKDGKPVMLYYGEYGGEGVRRLVEAKYENQIVVPGRGKSCSTRAMPHLRAKFDTFHEFASATLPQIYTKECLTASEKFEVNTLESGIFVNDGTGSFTFKPLPRIAQASTIFGLAFLDGNGDGKLDLYAVQNFGNPQFETPPFQGGLSVLLAGDGEGGFAHIPHQQSGLIVASDARGLAVTDFNLDGRPDLLVGVNNGELRAFTNRRIPKHRILRLKGPAGNPLAAGARVFLKGEKTTQVTEVYHGGGYLSQSSSLVFVDPDVREIEVAWPGRGENRTSLRLTASEGDLLMLGPGVAPD